jgi:hypothetical protein
MVSPASLPIKRQEERKLPSSGAQINLWADASLPGTSANGEPFACLGYTLWSL